ncbi:hypothetical protein TNCV_2095541 [Trichonephila clavipes]|nr:hypothetical protein TNCV_2095541 [Trichonephila clavipes]
MAEIDNETSVKALALFRNCGNILHAGGCISNAFVWYKYFSDRRDTVEDDQRNESPISSRTPEIIEKVRNIAANNQCA